MLKLTVTGAIGAIALTAALLTLGSPPKASAEIYQCVKDMTLADGGPRCVAACDRPENKAYKASCLETCAARRTNPALRKPC